MTPEDEFTKYLQGLDSSSSKISKKPLWITIIGILLIYCTIALTPAVSHDNSQGILLQLPLRNIYLPTNHKFSKCSIFFENKLIAQQIKIKKGNGNFHILQLSPAQLLRIKKYINKYHAWKILPFISYRNKYIHEINF